jgi:hypothetical protein
MVWACHGAPTTLKTEGEVTSLSGADKREVRVQGEVKIFL